MRRQPSRVILFLLILFSTLICSCTNSNPTTSTSTSITITLTNNWKTVNQVILTRDSTLVTYPTNCSISVGSTSSVVCNISVNDNYDITFVSGSYQTTRTDNPLVLGNVYSLTVNSAGTITYN